MSISILVWLNVQVRRLPMRMLACVWSLIVSCWGLVLKCYESRTRQQEMLNVNILRPSKHYFPKDIMIFGTKVMKDAPSSA
jgi:hypothetical protein